MGNAWRQPGRVLVVGPLPAPYNGMTVVTETILSSWLREGFDIVHVDTSDHRTISNVGRLDVRNIALGLKATADMLRALGRRDVELVYLPIAKNRLGFLRDAPLLLAARATRRTTMVHFHARGFDEFRRSQPRWMREVIQLCLKSERTHAIVLGERLRNEFGGLIPGQRVHVLPNGVTDHRTKADNTTSGPPTVLHLSTLWSAKGVFEVLESAANLRSRFPGIRYVLAGAWFSPAEARRAERYVTDHDLPDSVRVLGPVTGDQKSELLATATVLVFPSHSEGHPLVVLEALSASLPVIATRVGAIPEIIDDGKEGFLVEPGDVDALIERIAQVIGDPALRAEMGRLARDRYERDFTANRFVDELGSIWCSITGHNRRAVAHQPSESKLGAIRS
jgi:glycosyltransferase involved in cell wall biosynthesis